MADENETAVVEPEGADAEKPAGVQEPLTDRQKDMLQLLDSNPDRSVGELSQLMVAGYDAQQAETKVTQDKQEAEMFKEREVEIEDDEPMTVGRFRKSEAERDKKDAAKEADAQRLWEHEEAIRQGKIMNPHFQRLAILYVDDLMANNPSVTVRQGHEMYAREHAKEMAGGQAAARSKQVAQAVDQSTQVAAADASSVPSGGGMGNLPPSKTDEKDYLDQAGVDRFDSSPGNVARVCELANKQAAGVP